LQQKLGRRDFLNCHQRLQRDLLAHSAMSREWAFSFRVTPKTDDQVGAKLGSFSMASRPGSTSPQSTKGDACSRCCLMQKGKNAYCRRSHEARTRANRSNRIFSLIAQGDGEAISSRSRLELALRDYAKLICSAVFISGRQLAEAERNSGPLTGYFSRSRLRTRSREPWRPV
jgi:hypothetical protein